MVRLRAAAVVLEEQVLRHRGLLVSWAAPVVALHLVSGAGRRFSTWCRYARQLRPPGAVKTGGPLTTDRRSVVVRVARDLWSVIRVKGVRDRVALHRIQQPAPLADPRAHRHRAADGRPRRDDREHRASLPPRRRWGSPTSRASGSSRHTHCRSEACCSSADGSATSSAASGSSSPVWPVSRRRPRSAASQRVSTSSSAHVRCRACSRALLAPAALSLLTTTFTIPESATGRSPSSG